VAAQLILAQPLLLVAMLRVFRLVVNPDTDADQAMHTIRRDAHLADDDVIAGRSTHRAPDERDALFERTHLHWRERLRR